MILERTNLKKKKKLKRGKMEEHKEQINACFKKIINIRVIRGKKIKRSKSKGREAVEEYVKRWRNEEARKNALEIS